jgi:(1->4)-alpha-D-glucan 1-alpha-D-glucosylmutase
LYIYNRLLSLNEVGGDPERFGLPITAFHDQMRQRQASWPGALSATATHDTKRGEDMRARLNVLSELASVWKLHLSRWSRFNKRYKIELDGHAVPDRNEEYLLYQTLVGAWPLEPMDDAQYRHFSERIQQYIDKALREAKVHTSWLNPIQPYDEAMHKFIEAILDRTRPNPFLDDLLEFHHKTSTYGMYNSLSQALCKIAAPGVPDFYQGTELWDFSLVDPDNRRPVDFAQRMCMSEELEQNILGQKDRRMAVRELVASKTDGRIKLYIIMAALRVRRDYRALFLDGTYEPLISGGAQAAHVCAFSRQHENRTVVAIAPRLLARLIPDPSQLPLGVDVWRDTSVSVPNQAAGAPPSRYRNIFTGEWVVPTLRDGQQVLLLADVFAHCPVALLENQL